MYQRAQAPRRPASNQCISVPKRHDQMYGSSQAPPPENSWVAQRLTSPNLRLNSRQSTESIDSRADSTAHRRRAGVGMGQAEICMAAPKPRRQASKYCSTLQIAHSMLTKGRQSTESIDSRRGGIDFEACGIDGAKIRIHKPLYTIVVRTLLADS